jgi:hypothetical protein
MARPFSSEPAVESTRKEVMTLTHQEKYAVTTVVGILLVLYLLSGRRWSDEGRVRRWLKGK